MNKIEVELRHHWGEHNPGDVLEVEERTARQLVDGGSAVYRTVADAKEAGDPEAATSRRKAKE
jgi:hypothetical protein